MLAMEIPIALMAGLVLAEAGKDLIMEKIFYFDVF